LSPTHFFLFPSSVVLITACPASFFFLESAQSLQLFFHGPSFFPPNADGRKLLPPRRGVGTFSSASRRLISHAVFPPGAGSGVESFFSMVRRTVFSPLFFPPANRGPWRPFPPLATSPFPPWDQAVFLFPNDCPAEGEPPLNSVPPRWNPNKCIFFLHRFDEGGTPPPNDHPKQHLRKGVCTLLPPVFLTDFGNASLFFLFPYI